MAFLFKLPKGAAGHALEPAALSEAYVDGDTVQSDRPITICGNHPARFFSTRSLHKKHATVLSEMALTEWSGQYYLARYSRPEHTPADPQAEAAIRSLCVK